jgi:hypothetical protein
LQITPSFNFELKLELGFPNPNQTTFNAKSRSTMSTKQTRKMTTLVEVQVRYNPNKLELGLYDLNRITLGTKSSSEVSTKKNQELEFKLESKKKPKLELGFFKLN